MKFGARFTDFTGDLDTIVSLAGDAKSVIRQIEDLAAARDRGSAPHGALKDRRTSIPRGRLL